MSAGAVLDDLGEPDVVAADADLLTSVVDAESADSCAGFEPPVTGWAENMSLVAAPLQLMSVNVAPPSVGLTTFG